MKWTWLAALGAAFAGVIILYIELSTTFSNLSTCPRNTNDSDDDIMDGGDSWPAAHGVPGTLHYIPPNLAAFEPAKALNQTPSTNTLLWIGGMFDTFLSVSYPFVISKALPQDWSLVTTSLSSAGKSWGTSSIARDATEIANIITYFRTQRPNGKIVIMGHSTGCQDCMEYLVGPKSESRPLVQGVILQAPVSDRQALEQELPKAHMDETNQLALKLCRSGTPNDSLPNRLTAPAFGRMAITARRWLDVASPGPDHDGADDYFSSDLPDERLEKTFGKLPASTPLLILEGGADESIPENVSREELVGRWVKAVQEGGGQVDTVNGGVVPEATHNLNDNAENVRQDLVARVVGFIGRLDKGEFGTQSSARI